MPANTSLGVSATQEFFDRRVLQLTGGIHELGELRLELLGLLVLAWVIVYFCLWKGVAMTGKVVYLTATLPILLLVAFTVRGLSLPGSTEGLRFFFSPDWQKVMEPQVWVNAASQVFNSVGIAFGSLIAFSSYNKFHGPVLRDTLIVTLVDAAVSLLCGVAVFAVLGNLAHEQGRPVSEVVADGPGLVFVVFPHALAQMPYPQVFLFLSARSHTCPRSGLSSSSAWSSCWGWTPSLPPWRSFSPPSRTAGPGSPSTSS